MHLQCGNQLICQFWFVERIVEILAIIGIENIMWSSDYPHYDSTWPESLRVIGEHFAGVPEAEKRLMVSENVRRIYGF